MDDEPMRGICTLSPYRCDTYAKRYASPFTLPSTLNALSLSHASSPVF